MKRHQTMLGSAVVASALLLGGCQPGDDDTDYDAVGQDEQTADAGAEGESGGESGDGHAQEIAGAQPRLVTTYDGGIMTVDATTLEVIDDTKLSGFNRLNPVGDDRHLMVSVAEGFRLFDAGVWTKPHGDHTHSYAADPRLTDTVFDTELPGHVVIHDGSTVLFGDGDGKIQTFDTDDFSDDPKPEVSTVDEPHHGVAVRLSDGTTLHTVGTEDERSGAMVVDEDGEEIASSEDCPGVHGEAAAEDEAIALGCEDGILLYKDGKFDKIDAPDDYGRIGNQAGSEDSRYILGDYKVDEDAELERPEKVSVTDTKDGKLSLVDLGTSYSFRSLGRGPEGEGIVLTTDGSLKIIDPATASVTEEYPVIDEWKEPVEWQKARPTLFVQDEVAYVSEPAKQTIHIVDLDNGEVMASEKLPHATNELTGVAG